MLKKLRSAARLPDLRRGRRRRRRRPEKAFPTFPGRPSKAGQAGEQLSMLYAGPITKIFGRPIHKAGMCEQVALLGGHRR